MFLRIVKAKYEPKTKKFNAEYTYENQTSDDVSVFDNDDAWFEEEQRRLENLQNTQGITDERHRKNRRIF